MKQNGFDLNSMRRTCSTRRLPSTSTTIYNRFRTAGSLLNLRNVNLFNGYDWQSPLNGTSSVGIPVPPDVLKPLARRIRASAKRITSATASSADRV